MLSSLKYRYTYYQRVTIVLQVRPVERQTGNITAAQTKICLIFSKGNNLFCTAAHVKENLKLIDKRMKIDSFNRQESPSSHLSTFSQINQQ